jgi:hypothetical protein
VLDELARRASGRPAAALVLAWVLAMLDDDRNDDTVDSVEVAHAFRCDEDYVCWCVEVGVRRGDLRHTPPPGHPPRRLPPVEAWRRSGLDPLARLALEARYDDVLARRRRRAEGG